MNLFDLGPIATGLIGGVLFGIALEGAGFASPCKLVGQLRFRDWTVFNVMFTAIIVASVGIYILQVAGVLTAADLFIPTVFFWATLAGGAFVGIGMGVGGYCPGTCIVGFSSGHLDGIVFFIGLILGPLIFAGIYNLLVPMLVAAQGPTAQTVPQLLHVPGWIVLAAMIVMLIGVGMVTRYLRDRDAQKQAAAQAGPGASGGAGFAPSPSRSANPALQARVATHQNRAANTHT